jgi:uncharacterized protein YfeS
MSKQLLVLEEVLAMLETIGASKQTRENFRRQAEGVLAKRPTRGHDEVTVSSGYGRSSQRGFVELTLDEVRTQMESAKAREIGLMLIQAAEAAESDEIFLKLLTEKIGLQLDDHARGAFLLDLREIRQGTRDISRPH